MDVCLCLRSSLFVCLLVHSAGVCACTCAWGGGGRGGGGEEGRGRLYRKSDSDKLGIPAATCTSFLVLVGGKGIIFYLATLPNHAIPTVHGA